MSCDLRRKALIGRFREMASEDVPLPGEGKTAERHRRLFAVGREDLSLARLIEAHWDAVAILAENGVSAKPGVLYGVWAAEGPGMVLRHEAGKIFGRKPFCSGASIVDRALVTVREPDALLMDADVLGGKVRFDESAWKASAFVETKTAVAEFDGAEGVAVGTSGFYLSRPGFWHGACGPAACWAGGAAGLVDWAREQRRDDPHTMAHLGAMTAAVYAMESALDAAGREIDAHWDDVAAGQRRALMVRHIVEQGCSDVLRRLARAYGPHPLAMDEAIGRRYTELDLYVRQCHAERDLEVLGRATHTRAR